MLVVGQEDHIFPLVSKVAVQIRAHVLDIVDAAAQLASLPEVVDADEQCFPAAIAGRVFERVAVGSAVAEVLLLCWRRRRPAVISMCPLVAGGRGHHA